jgi:uncharacterized protein YdeI (BOF family)
VSNLVKSSNNYLIFFTDNSLEIKVTSNQYKMIKDIINDNQFIEINGELYNRSVIRKIKRERNSFVENKITGVV